MDITKINGNEVINFLNRVSKDDDSEWDKTSIIAGSLKFVSQELNNDKYKLEFTTEFNNWGTHQSMRSNRIIVTKESEIWVNLNEPHEGDGSELIIEELLGGWLPIHGFNPNYKKDFYELMQEIHGLIPEITITNKNGIDDLMLKLATARTYMK